MINEVYISIFEDVIVLIEFSNVRADLSYQHPVVMSGDAASVYRNLDGNWVEVSSQIYEQI